MLQRTFCTLLIALSSCLSAGPAAATEGSDGTVSGSATVIVRPAATRLRMQMALRAYGKTPQAAMENLKSRREAAVARLKALGADPASISFGAPWVGPAAKAASAVSPILSAPPATYAPVPADGGSAPPLPEPSVALPPAPRAKAAKRPPLFTASTTLRAEWPLPPAGEGPERLAAAAAEIQEKVGSADLASAGPQKLSAEEQELIEEAQMGLTPPGPAGQLYPAQPSSGWTTAPAGPAFVFVAALSDAQRKAALADACARAKQDAAELAEAAGMQLGPITSLNRNTMYNFSPNVFSSDEGEGPSPLKKSSEFEAVAANADGLEFSIGVSVSYRLLPPGGKP